MNSQAVDAGAGAAGSNRGTSHHSWWALVAVCLAIFMLLLDVTIVNVALPTIQSKLDADFSDLQWIVDAYALALASLLLMAGSIADRAGRRLMFLVGIVVFLAASFACGLAGSPAFLISARAVQGIGGAMMFATSLALLASNYRGRERAIAFGVFGAVTGLAVAVGPTLGGMLTSWATWRWIFLVNIPVGIVGLVLTLKFVDESSDPVAGSKPDVLGMLTFSAASFALVLALIEGRGWGWTSPRIVGLFVVTAVLMGAFVLIERAVRHPMFDLGLFRNRSFLGAAIVAFTMSASIMANFLFIVIYMQRVLGFDALGVGVRFLPLSLAAFVVAAASGRLTETFPRRIMLGVGMSVIALSLVLMAMIDTSSKWTALIPGFIAGGIGMGIANPALASTAVGVVDSRRSGMASGINSTYRQLGMATGIAALGAIFSQRIETHITDALAATPAARMAGTIADGVANGTAGGPPPGVPVSEATHAAIGHAIRSGFVNSLQDVLHVAAAVAAVGAALALALVRESDFVDQSHHAPAATDA